MWFVACHINKGKNKQISIFFNNFTSKTMKKLLITLGLLALIMLGTRSVATATPITWCVNISITDTCMGGNYSGDYCVELELHYGTSTVICTATNCVITGSGCASFTCNISSTNTDKGYWVKVVHAARYPSGDCATSGQSSIGYNYWSDMIDCINCPCNLKIIF